MCPYEPIGLVPKSGQGQWTMIVYISFPFDNSVNDGVPSTLSFFSYSSVDDVADLILCLGKGTRLVKVDLKHTYGASTGSSSLGNHVET